VSRRTMTIVMIILGVLGLLMILYFFFADKKGYTWYESYRSSSNQPYGTLFMKRLLEETRDGEFIVREKNGLNKILDDENFRKESTYVFVGESIYLSETDKKALMNFVYEGNNAFIASKEVPDFLIDIYDTECNNLIITDTNDEQTATMNFYHPNFHQKYGYKYSYRMANMDLHYDWKYYNQALFCDSTKNLTPLGYMEPDAANFLRVKHGRGYVFLHSNPLVFTNYFLTQKQKLQYASAVFSHMPGQNVIWEEFAKVPLPQMNQEGFNGPLYYIMQQPSLKYAWWLLIATVLLYVFFAAKRTQRIIPVLEAKTNTSLEYVKLISALHYQNKNHMDMARKKMKYFHYFIRSKYGIHAQVFNDDLIAKLSVKSNVPVEEVRAVFKFHKLIEEGSNGIIDEIRLSNFYNVIENFYKKCK
jgi:hypothetical protein